MRQENQDTNIKNAQTPLQYYSSTTKETVNQDKIKQNQLCCSEDYADKSFISRTTNEATTKVNKHKNMLSDSMFENLEVNKGIGFPIYKDITDYFIFAKVKKLTDRKSFSAPKERPTINNTIDYGFRTPNFAIKAIKTDAIETNPMLPRMFKDNEKEKLKLISFIRPVKNKIISDTHKFTVNRKRKITELNDEIKNDFTIFKRKKSSSAKKFYESLLPLFSNNHSTGSLFRFYREGDIGIKKEWQEHFITQDIDNDYDSDKDIIKGGIQETRKNLLEGLTEYTGNAKYYDRKIKKLREGKKQNIYN